MLAVRIDERVNSVPTGFDGSQAQACKRRLSWPIERLESLSGVLGTLLESHSASVLEKPLNSSALRNGFLPLSEGNFAGIRSTPSPNPDPVGTPSQKVAQATRMG